MADFISIAIQTVAFGAGIFGVTAGIASHLRYRALTGASASPESGATGLQDQPLDPRQTFLLRLSTYLGSLHKDPSPFSVLLLSLQNREALEAERGQAFIEAAMQHVETSLRGIIRRGDTCQRFEAQTLGVILSLRPERAEATVRRLAESVTHTFFAGPNGTPLQLALDAGLASFPVAGTSASDLFRSAEQALAEAAKASDSAKLHLVSATPSSTAAPTGEAEAPGSQEAKGTAGGLLDELTEVLRSDRLGGAMQKFIAKLRKSELPASLVAVDIDSLRRYNEHYGTSAGDAILKSVSAILQKSCREEDLIGRADEDEFLICMACNPGEAEIAAQRILLEIKREVILHGGNKLRVTACAGVAGYPDDGGAPRVLFEKAEIALHNAKSRGRAVATRYQENLYRPQKSARVAMDRF